ncbi:barstar family protein [Streptomyces qinglanensis]|uniref:Barstar (Barnase inhibitor) n=1 Tax=Streptomyces qinglanensis TaxID=943816 RepID=A0A1H9N150_9ACTN|nr:barstar family protein [Streptomyces qinglanensis]SER29551.1 Barstar (barnase inhibitor) [Streptomyces qinglanensis]
MTSPVDLPELPQADLPGLFDDSVPPGVYRLPSVGPDALMQADAAGWFGAVVDLTGVDNKAEFMERCATGLELPDYFGRNWDALADLLTDLSWYGKPDGYLLLATGWSGFEHADPADAAAAAEVFTAAVGFWAVRETPLSILLG